MDADDRHPRSRTRDWLQNDQLFLEELREGHRWAALVADRISALGVRCMLTPMTLRRTVEDRHAWRDEADIVVGGGAVVEVKSRRLHFTGPHDYPYPSAFVDTLTGWEGKLRKPIAVVLTSRTGGGLAIVRGSRARAWRPERRFDHVRAIHDTFLLEDRDQLATWEAFGHFLRRHYGSHRP